MLLKRRHVHARVCMCMCVCACVCAHIEGHTGCAGVPTALGVPVEQWGTVCAPGAPRARSMVPVGAVFSGVAAEDGVCPQGPGCWARHCHLDPTWPDLSVPGTWTARF